MKQLFVILTLLLLLTSYTFAQTSTDTETSTEQEEIVEIKTKSGGWLAVGIGFSSVDAHLGYHFPNTDMDVRLLANYLYSGNTSIQAELLSFFPNSNGLGAYSGLGVAWHNDFGFGLATSTGVDIGINNRSGVLIESGTNIFFRNTNAEGMSFFPAPVQRFSIGYRYSF